MYCGDKNLSFLCIVEENTSKEGKVIRNEVSE